MLNSISRSALGKIASRSNPNLCGSRRPVGLCHILCWVGGGWRSLQGKGMLVLLPQSRLLAVLWGSSDLREQNHWCKSEQLGSGPCGQGMGVKIRPNDQIQAPPPSCAGLPMGLPSILPSPHPPKPLHWPDSARARAA